MQDAYQKLQHGKVLKNFKTRCSVTRLEDTEDMKSYYAFSDATNLDTISKCIEWIEKETKSLIHTGQMIKIIMDLR